MPTTRPYPGEPLFRSLRAVCGDRLLSLIEAVSPTRSEPNAAFSIGVAEAKDTLSRLSGEPVVLQRPVLVLNGYRGPDFQALVLKEKLRRCTDGDLGKWMAVSYLTASDLPAMVTKVMRAVDQRWPRAGGTAASVPLDVVAISMGGIVARIAAVGLDAVGLAGPELPRLDVVRLFTLATPHRGSRLADMIAPDAAARAVKFGSPLLERLDGAWAAHVRERPVEQVCYTRLDDRWVGATRASPPGQMPIWLEGCGPASHGTVSREPRILADLALRLRGEASVARASVPPRD